MRIRMSRVVARCLAGLTAVGMAAPALGQGAYPDDLEHPYADETGIISVRTGLGFTADPETFLLGFEGDYVFSDPFSAGVLLQLGVDDDRTIVSPVAYARYRLKLGQFNPDLRRLEPYVQAGLGLTWWDVDRRPPRRNDDDTEFLLNFGFGMEYRLTDHVSAGTHLLFNIVPNEIFDERFYFSWEVATIRYRF